mgnify:CR=1 FL=1
MNGFATIGSVVCHINIVAIADTIISRFFEIQSTITTSIRHSRQLQKTINITRSRYDLSIFR